MSVYVCVCVYVCVYVCVCVSVCPCANVACFGRCFMLVLQTYLVNRCKLVWSDGKRASEGCERINHFKTMLIVEVINLQCSGTQSHNTSARDRKCGCAAQLCDCVSVSVLQCCVSMLCVCVCVCVCARVCVSVCLLSLALLQPTSQISSNSLLSELRSVATKSASEGTSFARLPALLL